MPRRSSRRAADSVDERGPPDEGPPPCRDDRRFAGSRTYPITGVPKPKSLRGWRSGGDTDAEGGKPAPRRKWVSSPSNSPPRVSLRARKAKDEDQPAKPEVQEAVDLVEDSESYSPSKHRSDLEFQKDMRTGDSPPTKHDDDITMRSKSQRGDADRYKPRRRKHEEEDKPPRGSVGRDLGRDPGEDIPLVKAWRGKGCAPAAHRPRQVPADGVAVAPRRRRRVDRSDL